MASLRGCLWASYDLSGRVARNLQRMQCYDFSPSITANRGHPMTSPSLLLRSEPQLRPELRGRLVFITTAQFLTMSANELDDCIERELADNPVLEAVRRCARCGRPSALYVCKRCRGGAFSGAREATSLSTGREILAVDALASAPTELHHAVEMVVASLDGHGLLTTTTFQELCSLARCDPRQMEAAIAAVRKVGQPGVATFDARSCLLAQIDALDTAGNHWVLGRRIVESHLCAVAEGRLSDVAEISEWACRRSQMLSARYARTSSRTRL